VSHEALLLLALALLRRALLGGGPRAGRPLRPLPLLEELLRLPRLRLRLLLRLRQRLRQRLLRLRLLRLRLLLLGEAPLELRQSDGRALGGGRRALHASERLGDRLEHLLEHGRILLRRRRRALGRAERLRHPLLVLLLRGGEVEDLVRVRVRVRVRVIGLGL